MPVRWWQLPLRLTTVYTEARFRSTVRENVNGANKECLFLFVYGSASRAGAERERHASSVQNAPRDAQQEGPGLHFAIIASFYATSPEQ